MIQGPNGAYENTPVYTLSQFVAMFVAPNAICRIWKPTKRGDKFNLGGMVQPEQDTFMSWEVNSDKPSWIQAFKDRPVMYVADILCDTYPEAVNIILD